MILVGMLRFLRGAVEFRIEGGYPERFINLCAQKRIPVWNGRRQGHSYTAVTTLSGSRMLAELAEKSRSRLIVTRRRGVPAFGKRYRNRWGLIGGAVLMLTALFVCSLFIWQIEITGNQTIPEAEISALLQEMNIRPGVLRSSIDTREAERRLLIRLENAAWTAVNLRGSIAQIEIQERVVPPVTQNDDIPHNIVAAKTGYITYLEIYNGQTLVSVGDSVEAGQILVSGITEDRNGRNRLLHARGKVVAQTEESLSVQIPLTQKSYSCTGVKKRRYLYLFGYGLPLFWGSPIPQPYKKESARFEIPFLSSLLPVAYGKDQYLLLEEKSQSISEEQAKDLALAELEKLEAEMFAERSILERTLTAQIAGDIFLLEARYLCEGEIGKEVEILTG